MPVGDAVPADARSDFSNERDLGVPRRAGARPLSAAAGTDRLNRTGGFGTVSEERYLKLEVRLAVLSVLAPSSADALALSWANACCLSFDG